MAKLSLVQIVKSERAKLLKNVKAARLSKVNGSDDGSDSSSGSSNGDDT